MTDLVAPFTALCEDTLVHAARGLVPIRDIQPGDAVFSLDETANEIRPASVAQRIRLGRTAVLEIKVGTQRIRAACGQPFLTLVDRRREGRRRRRVYRAWAPLLELRPGDVVGVARKTPDTGGRQQMTIPSARVVQLRRSNPVTLPRESSPDLMWWAGLFIGDGWISKYRGTSTVEFAIPASDQPLRQELAATTERTFGLSVRSKSEWTVAIDSFRLADYLEANGFRGKARTKRVPSWVSALPEDERLAFLGGYTDADGTVAASRKDKGLSITSANRDLLEDTRRVAATCGLRGSIYRFTGTYRGQQTVAFRMRVLGDFDRIGCRSPQRTSRMWRRRFGRTFSSIKGFGFASHTNEWLGFARIHSICAADSADAYAITLDSGGSLVAEGVIVRADGSPLH